MRNERLVLDLCGKVIVILMVLSGRPFANSIGQMTEVGRRRPTRMLRNCVRWKMSSSIMRRYPGPDSARGALLRELDIQFCSLSVVLRSASVLCPLTTVQLLRHVHLRPTVILRVIVL